MTDIETFQPNLPKTEKPESFFGFSSVNFFTRGGFILAVAGFIILTQLVRLAVAHFNWPTFLNTKFAFSLDVPIVMIYLLYLLVFALIANYLRRHWSTLSLSICSGFILILAGGLANLGERIFFGYVTDYIFIFEGVLNLADCLIFLGVVLVIFSRPNSGNF